MKNKNLLKVSIFLASNVFLLPMASGNVGAFSWPWSKPKEPEKIVEKKETTSTDSSEVLEAYNAYIEAKDLTEEACYNYQQKSVAAQKASLIATEASEKLQEATANSTEADAKAVAAHNRWRIDHDPEGYALDEWEAKLKEALDARSKRDALYIEWIKFSSIEKQAIKERDEALNEYRSALLNQENANVLWAEVCAKDAVKQM